MAQRFCALIVAAGKGQRMSSLQPKQYLKILGKPMLQYSIEKCLNAPLISDIVVVLAADDAGFKALDAATTESVLTATGGATRAQSTLNGLDALSASLLSQGIAEEDVQVLVHDAARPCITVESIQKLCQQSDEKNGGLLAVPVTDTLHKASDSKIASSVDRSGLWRAQTPQCFPLKTLKEVLALAVSKNEDITDETSAMVRAGYAPSLVEGDSGNLKVTFPEDVALAEFYLKREKTACV